jgi:hypothetical protein
MKTPQAPYYWIESEFDKMPVSTKRFLNARRFAGIRALLRHADREPINIFSIGYTNRKSLQWDFPEWNFDTHGEVARPFIKTLYKGKYVYDRRTNHLSRA